MEEEIKVYEYENFESLQTKMCINIYGKKFHVQKNKWKSHNRNALCWGFYCVNDNKKKLM
jgi:hypothetical protein